MRDRAHHLDHALHDVVDPAAVIAGEPAQDHAQDDRHRDADEADGERDAHAVEDARKHVASQPVRAEQKQRPALRRAHQMQVAGNDAPPVVFVAAAEESDLQRLLRILGKDAFQGLHVELVVERIDERPDELALVEEVDRLRRHIDVLHVAGVLLVGRQELHHHDRSIHDAEDDRGQHRNAVTLELQRHQLPLRGEVDLLLLGGGALDRIGIERRRRDIVWQRRQRRRGAAGRGLLTHLLAPAPRRMRGSSSASMMSEMKTPTTVRNAMNIRNEPARYMSWLRSESSSIGPVSGSDITTDTMTEPEISSGSRLPMSAMKGLSEMRSGYLMSNRPGGRPLARPVVTYCLLSSSSRLARSRRIMPAVPGRPITSTGIHRCDRIDWNLSQLHAAPMYCGSIKPPIEMSKYSLAK